MAATTSTMTSLASSTSGIATVMASPTSPSYAMGNATAKITSPSLVSYKPTAVATVTTNAAGPVGGAAEGSAVLALMWVMLFTFGFAR